MDPEGLLISINARNQSYAEELLALFDLLTLAETKHLDPHRLK